ncbi:MAG: methyltransferase domain-containing protein [Phycisphaerae bacterium]
MSTSTTPPDTTTDPIDVGHDDQSHPRCARHIDYQGEEDFHDEWGKAIDPDTVPVTGSFEACTAPENQFVMNWLGSVKNLRVLDIGSGAGEAAVYFATQGADVTAVDLSSGMLDVVSQVADRHGVKVRCVQSRAESLDLPDNSFDIVYAANMLHHVDMNRCLNEVCRVLKPDGRFVAWDPLRHNPIINIYRRMATSVRTEDETPLDIRDVETFEQRFRSVSHRCFWLTSLWIFMRFFLIERVHPSKERYWKKIITDADRLAPLYQRLSAIDERLLRWFPWLGRMCWNVVICAEHPTKVIKQRVAPKEPSITTMPAGQPVPQL